METSDMWQIMPVWKKEASNKMSQQRIVLVNDTINNSRMQMQMDNMLPYHKLSIRMDQQVHEKLREKHFALAKGFYQLVNELYHYKGAS